MRNRALGMLRLTILGLLYSVDSSAKAIPTSPFGFTGTPLSNKHVQKLLKLVPMAQDPLIYLDADGFKEYMGEALSANDQKLPYSLVVFFTATDLKTDQDLRLPQWREEFALVASSYRREYRGSHLEGRVFFLESDHSASPEIFQVMEVGSVPQIKHIAPNYTVAEDGASLLFPPQDNYDMKDPSAEGIAEWVESVTGLPLEAVHRPTIWDEPWVPYVGTAMALAVPPVSWYTWHSTWFNHRAFWCALAILVYWFSVSGGLYNIIREVPFTLTDPSTRETIFFSDKPTTQLGFEGFFVGTVYLAIAGSVVVTTHVVPHVSSPALKRVCTYAALLVFGAGSWYVLGLWQKKSGMDIFAVGLQSEPGLTSVQTKS